MTLIIGSGYVTVLPVEDGQDGGDGGLHGPGLDGVREAFSPQILRVLERIFPDGLDAACATGGSGQGHEEALGGIDGDSQSRAKQGFTIRVRGHGPEPAPIPPAVATAKLEAGT